MLFTLVHVLYISSSSLYAPPPPPHYQNIVSVGLCADYKQSTSVCTHAQRARICCHNTDHVHVNGTIEPSL